MDSKPLEFLETLLSTPGPSGYEQKIQQVVRDYAADFADSIETDLHGNVALCRNPKAPLRVMLAGHCDQIGWWFRISTTVVLPTRRRLAVGSAAAGLSADDDLAAVGPIAAVIARKPIHLLRDDERKQVVKLEDLWLDVGASSEQEAREIIEIGDPVTLDLGMQRMRNNLANAPGMDNRTGVWVVVEALRRCGPRLDCAVYSVSTVAEEIGLRGAKTSAYGIDPQIGIAVDVTHATDCRRLDQRQQGKISLGGGPVVFRGPNMNPKVAQRLFEVGDESRINYQRSALGRAAPNDSNALQINRGGVAAGLVAVPNRYMHSAVETISLDDIDAAADLLAQFINGLRADDDFTP